MKASPIVPAAQEALRDTISTSTQVGPPTVTGLACALREISREMNTAIPELTGMAAVISPARDASVRLAGGEDITAALELVGRRLDSELFRLEAAREVAAQGYQTDVRNNAAENRHV